MPVSFDQIRTLSDQTGCSLELCKIALQQSINFEEATVLLCKWTQKLEFKSKEDNKTSLPSKLKDSLEKYVITASSPEFDAIGGLLVRCANTEIFSSKEFYNVVRNCANEYAQYAHYFLNESALIALEKSYNTKIHVSAFRMEKQNKKSLLTSYNHSGMISSIVETSVHSDEAFKSKQFRNFSFDLALHVTAFDPISIKASDFPEEEKRKKILSLEDELGSSGKSINLWPTIIEGKLSKWIEQKSLLSQLFIKSEKNTVDHVRLRVSEKIGSEISIKNFIRMS